MRSITRLICLTALAVTASSAVVAAAPSYTQTFTLRPGWNSVYLEVEPAARATADVFQGIPVASVWAWEPRRSTVDFIQNPSDGLFNRPGWLGYFPAGRPEAILTNLFIVQANRAYLIKLEGSSPVVWTVTGRPALDAASWVPNSFNLVGLPVDPAVPPTFGQYFASSPAHDGQPIYRLGSGGVWEPVTMPFATSIRSGEAYWVFCSGASEYAGPVDVSLP
ncbi:MAG TPA: hypothetical protein VFM29_05475, partial [Vicinamibacteria bacterium]|nr:hypothetical protein [Vicinamibacteria bacterium]